MVDDLKEQDIKCKNHDTNSPEMDNRLGNELKDQDITLVVNNAVHREKISQLEDNNKETRHILQEMDNRLRKVEARQHESLGVEKSENKARDTRQKVYLILLSAVIGGVITTVGRMLLGL